MLFFCLFSSFAPTGVINCGTQPLTYPIAAPTLVGGGNGGLVLMGVGGSKNSGLQ